MRLLIVIPAFNEQEALSSLLAEIRALDPTDSGAEISTVVVDDGSADRTAEVARAGGARVIRLCRNLGIGGAVQSGLRVAYREKFDYAVQIDGDGQHPPMELKKLVAAANASPNADLVVGTRYSNSDNFRSTFMRRLGSWWIRAILRVIARLRVTDPTSGFRLYGRRALELFDQTYPYDYPEPEALAIARARGLQVIEAPVQMRERQGGLSSIAGLSSIYYMVKITVAIVLTYVRSLGSKVEDTNESSG